MAVLKINEESFDWVGKSKQAIDFWLKKPTPKEKSITKCYTKTKNGVEYSIVETTITNPCKKKNSKYSAGESFDDSNTSESSKTEKKIINLNHYAMPKGYTSPGPDFLPHPPSNWIRPKVNLTNTESCEIPKGFEPTTSDFVLLPPYSLK